MTMNFLNSNSPGYWNRSRTVCVSENASVQASELKLPLTSFPGSVSLVFRWITLAFTLLSSLQGLAYNCNVTVINGGTKDYWQTGTILTIYGRICVSPYAWTTQPFSLPPGKAHTFLGVELCGSPDFLRIQYSDGSNWVVTPSKAAVNGGNVTFTIYPYGKGIVDGDDRPPECESSDCSTCGMPVWRVSQPYINLWLEDEPLGYQPALGPRISLTLSYNQKDDHTGSDGTISSFGNKWNVSWLSYVVQDANLDKVVYLPGGGSITFTNRSDFLTNTRLSGDTNTGFTLSYPGGSKNVYGYTVTNSSGAFQEAFLTEQWNAIGQKTTFEYYSYAPSAPVVLLKDVV